MDRRSASCISVPRRETTNSRISGSTAKGCAVPHSCYCCLVLSVVAVGYRDGRDCRARLTARARTSRARRIERDTLPCPCPCTVALTSQMPTMLQSRILCIVCLHWLLEPCAGMAKTSKGVSPNLESMDGMKERCMRGSVACCCMFCPLDPLAVLLRNRCANSLVDKPVCSSPQIPIHACG